MILGWDKNTYYIDGKPGFLISGEFHYFSVPKQDWRKRLELLKQAGGNCVATYIPWILHEPEEGRVLFGDCPERDLEGFLQLCSEMKLFAICRPGPYQYSEIIYDGLPGWLCENYPEIQARDIFGKPFHSASISYLHPLFLEKARKWYEKVCPTIAKYTVSRGGPVAFVQFDNELMGIHIWRSGGWDYNEEAMGIGKPGGRYPQFLYGLYGEIEALNHAYDTSFSCFSDIRPCHEAEPRSIGGRRRVKDYQDFYLESISRYTEILVGWMREYGIDCDVVHNSPNPSSNSLFLETAGRLGSGFLLGSDHYYCLGPDWPQNNPTPQYAAMVFYSNETLRLMGYPPTVMELPGGSCSDWPPFISVDAQCCYYTNLAFGMKGLNYYIFTGVPNPCGIGQYGDVYDYGAGIGANGEIRPLYGVQKLFGKFLAEHSWLAESERAVDFHMGLNWEYSRSKSYFSKSGESEFSNVAAHEFMLKGIMISALNTSFSPDFVDLYSEEFVQGDGKPLVVISSVAMSRLVQQRIVRFVENGGSLLIAPVMPYMDENFNSCTELVDFLGGTSVREHNEDYSRVNIGSVRNVYVNGKLYESVTRPANAVGIAEEEISGKEVGWKLNFLNGGTVVWLGMQWTHSMFTHGDTLKFLLSELDCKKPAVQCDNPNIWTSLRKCGDNSILFAMNLFSSPLSATMRIEGNGPLSAWTDEIELKPMEVRALAVDIKGVEHEKV